MTALSPAELFGFLSSLNFMYGSTTDVVLVLQSQTNGFMSIFSTMLNAYYAQQLGADLYPLFVNLMQAMEMLAINEIKGNSIQLFKDAMSALNTAYGKLQPADQAKFGSYLSAAYDKYLALYELYNANGSVALDSDTEAYFSALADSLNDYIEINNYLANFGKNGNETLKSGTYAMIFSLYSKVYGNYNQILALAEDNPEVLTALCTNTYNINGVNITLDKAFFKIGMLYWSYATTELTIKLGDALGQPYDYSLYYIYKDTNLRVFLGYGADLLYAQYKGEALNFDKEYISYVMKTFQSEENYALDVNGFNLSCYLEATKLYYDALERYFETVFSSDASTQALADKIIAAARKYADFAYTGDTSMLDEFVSLMNDVIDSYDAMNDSSSFDGYLKDLYDQYKAIYISATTPSENS